jgi:predicted translation initiation factor SUI1
MPDSSSKSAPLTSFADLAALLAPEDATSAPDGKSASQQAPQAPQATKLGYDGKPQKLRVSTEKRTGTKTVTVVRGFQARPGDLESIIATLKKRCGTGGKMLDNEIELQGDHSATVRNHLQTLGYTVM